ncbi:hypothetical protein LSH36_433g03003 [Paralvinella palmiformis]|uniref:Choline transporter-like protein n=1 Tax=Paralvinella palmiformis TaxID=53620 RepID=A0AAD9JBP8_9ANNE|nr:hypothetical protein LSH36_433g03003 [Paralvinella palmiformis]
MMGCCGNEQPEPKENPISRKNVCCTDIVALILFVAFVGLMVYIAVFSIMNGDGKKLVYGYDSFGNTCNQNNVNNKIPNVTDSGRDLQGFSHVFFMSVFDPFGAMQICVKECPDKDLITPEQVKEFAEKTGSRLCHYDVKVSDYGNIDLYNSKGKGLCPKLPIFKSLSVLQRCAPDPSVLFQTKDAESGSSVDDSRKNATITFFKIFELDNLFKKILNDLYLSWREMIILCVFALVVSFLMVLMIRYLAAVVVWLIVVLAAVGSLAGTGFLWWTFVILLLILLVLRKRISLAVALFKEAGKCLMDLPSLLVQPIWTFIILILFFIYWLIVLAFIGTSGHPEANYERGFQSVDFVLEGFAVHFWWIHLIGLIWISEVILASQQFVIGGSVALWYFTRNKKKLGCPCCSVISSLVLHHIGSVAAGALIITLVKIPRYILMYINSKLKGKENGCAKCCAKCCICCLWCLEKVLKFINQNAYTLIAMRGMNFCSAARKAFEIITKNVLRVAVINSVGTFVLFLGKIGVAASTCVVAVIWLRMVVDALLLCFSEDCDINRQTQDYYMNSSLMKCVEETSSKLERISKSRKKSSAEDSPDGKEMVPLSNQA